MGIRILLFVAMTMAGPVWAQDRLAGSVVTDLAEAVHLPPEQLRDRLADTIIGFRTTRGPQFASDSDPFLYVVTGAFGADTETVPAGLIHCARYGLDTRDTLLSSPASDPAVFPLVAALRPDHDDADVWPPEAIALMRCRFVWDDARRIAPWPEAVAVDLLTPLFPSLTRTDDATIRARSGDHIRAQYGPQGYRLVGLDGPRTSFAWLQSATVTRQLSHQQVSFRVFLLAGGV